VTAAAPAAPMARRLCLDASTSRLHLVRTADQLAANTIAYGLPLMVLAQTGSARWTGITVTLTWLPRIVAVSIGGPWIDRVGARRALAQAGLSRALLAALTAVALVIGGGGMWPAALAFGVAGSMLGRLTQSSVDALAAEVSRSDPEHSHKFQAQQTAIDQVSMLVGPLAAALLLGFGAWSLLAAVAVVSAGTALRLPAALQQPHAGNAPVARRPWRQAASVLREAPALRWIVLSAAGGNVLAGLIQAATPVMMTQTWHRSSAAVGVVWTLGAGASLLALIAAARVSSRFGLRITLAVGAVGCAAATAVAGLAPNSAVFAIAVVAMLALEQGVILALRTARPILIPAPVFATVSSVVTVLLLVPIPLTGLAVAAVGRSGVPALLIGGSALTALAGVVSAVALRRHSESLRPQRPFPSTSSSAKEATGMRILVLETSPVLSRHYADAGHEVLLAVPAAQVARRRAEGRFAQVLGAERWDDPHLVTSLISRLPEHPDAVATIDEQCTVVAAGLRDRYGTPGLALADAPAYRDKHVMMTRCRQATPPVLVAPTRLVHSPAGVAQALRDWGRPVVVKPRGGALAMGTIRVEDEGHLQECIAEGRFGVRHQDIDGRFGAGANLRSLDEQRMDGYLVQVALDVVEEWFVDLYLYRGELLLASPGRYCTPILTLVGRQHHFTLLPAGHEQARPVVELAREAVATLGVHTGVAHCEVLLDRQGTYWFGEAGARPGGGGIWPATGQLYGFDALAVLADLALDRRVDLPTDPRYPALTFVGINPEPGRVESITDPQDILALPGVVAATGFLKPGQDVPATFAYVPVGGHILFVPRDLAAVDAEVDRLRSALDLRVTPANTQLAQAAR
jgi:MFS family permease